MSATMFAWLTLLLVVMSFHTGIIILLVFSHTNLFTPKPEVEKYYRYFSIFYLALSDVKLSIACRPIIFETLVCSKICYKLG